MTLRSTAFAVFIATTTLLTTLPAYAQSGAANRGGSNRGGGAMSVPDHPQEVGEAGIAWYTTWKSGLEEAKRSNRPIFFMSAATVCSGVSGVF